MGRITGGSRERVDEFVNLFLQTSTNQLVQLTRAVDRSSFQEMRSMAHSCIGASKLIGANAMIPPMEALERLGASHSTEGAQDQLTRAWKELERIRSYFNPRVHSKHHD